MSGTTNIFHITHSYFMVLVVPRIKWISPSWGSFARLVTLAINWVPQRRATESDGVSFLLATMSCFILSCLVLSCLNCVVLSCVALFCVVLCYLVLSSAVMSCSTTEHRVFFSRHRYCCAIENIIIGVLVYPFQVFAFTMHLYKHFVCLTQKW